MLCVCVCVCAHACACMLVRACVCAHICVHACMCACVLCLLMFMFVSLQNTTEMYYAQWNWLPLPHLPQILITYIYIYLTYYIREYHDQITITLASLTIRTVSKTKDQPQSATVGHPCPWQAVSDHESLQQGPVFVSGLPQSGPAALALLNCWFLAAFGGGLCKPEALLLSSGQPWWGNQILNRQKCGILDLIRAGSLEHKRCKTPSACCLAWCGFYLDLLFDSAFENWNENCGRLPSWVHRANQHNAGTASDFHFWSASWNLLF